MANDPASTPTGQLRKKLLTVIGGLLTMACLGVLAYLVYRERDMLAAYVLTADSKQIGAVAAWYAATLVVYVIAWSSIMGRLSGYTGFQRHAVVFCLANMAKRLPGTLWYVGGRTLLYSRAGVPVRTVILASTIEGTLTLLAGAIVAVPFLAVAFPDYRWLWVAGGSALLILLLNPKSVRWLIDRATRGSDLHAVALRHIYAWLGLYVACWVMGGLMLGSVVSLFEHVPLSGLPWVIGTWAAAGTASMLATFLPSNLGISEVTMTGFLSQTVPAGLAALVAVGARALTTALDILAGGLALLIQRVNRA